MIISVTQLPESTRRMVMDKTNDAYVDVWWANACNNEGENYHELYIDSEDTLSNWYFKYGWGEITSLEEALEELE